MSGALLRNSVIEYAGANNQGWISNLGMGLSGGVLSILDAQGAAISSSNYGYVTVPSATDGLMQSIQVSTTASFNDDSNASSDLTNIGWGITETANWDQDVPFFLYVVNRGGTAINGTDGNSAFFISRNPWLYETNSDFNYIGTTTTAPSNDTFDITLLLGNYTITNYISLPCTCIGAFRMRWSTATDDWTVQALDAGDGIGESQLIKTFSRVWTFPTGQNGADEGFMKANGGTAAAFSNNTAVYSYQRNGYVRFWGNINGDGGTDGSGAVGMRMALPVPPNFSSSALNHFTGTAIVSGVTVNNSEEDAGLRIEHAGDMFFYSGDNRDTTLDNADFANGARKIEWDVEYYAGPNL